MIELYLIEPLNVFGGFQGRPEKTPFDLIGVPFDATTTFRPGSRFAPDSIRRASMDIEFYSIRNNLDFDEVGVRDLGNISTPPIASEMINRVKQVTSHIINNNRRLIVLGGEHTLTIGVVDAIKKLEPCIIIADAHLDLREEYLGSKLNHATTTRRLLEIVPPSKITLLGVRAFCKEEIEYANKIGLTYYTPTQMRILGMRELAKRIMRRIEECNCIYLSIDMDVFDPAYAPGVGNPEPEGITPTELLDTLHLIIDDRFIGFDVVEVNPLYDPSQITSILAAKIIVEIASTIYTRLKQPYKHGSATIYR